MSDTIFQIRSLGYASPLRTLVGILAVMDTSYALVREWWHRYRSRLELASYSHDQHKDLGFSADVNGEIGKPFWKKWQIQWTRRASGAKGGRSPPAYASSAASSLSIATNRLGRRRAIPLTQGPAAQQIALAPLIAASILVGVLGYSRQADLAPDRILRGTRPRQPAAFAPSKSHSAP